jgi:hypothetical protein
MTLSATFFKLLRVDTRPGHGGSRSNEGDKTYLL